MNTHTSQPTLDFHYKVLSVQEAANHLQIKPRLSLQAAQGGSAEIKEAWEPDRYYRRRDRSSSQEHVGSLNYPQRIHR